MGMTGVDLSRGPVTQPGVERGVHIIFHPAEVEVDPGPNVAADCRRARGGRVGDRERRADRRDQCYRGKPWHMVGGQAARSIRKCTSTMARPS